MTEYRIEIAGKAKQDLREIYLYVANTLQEPDIAIKLIDKLETEILTLKNMPMRCAPYRDEQLKRRNLRKLIVDNYLVFYTIYEKNQTVFIVRILYARRDWINLL